jgi:predicted DNA binding CopG/RHH family protein
LRFKTRGFWNGRQGRTGSGEKEVTQATANGVERHPLFTIRVPVSLIERIMAKAEADGLTRSDAAREALRLYVGEQDQAA